MEDIRAQLAYRGENAERLKSFAVGAIYGIDEKIYFDKDFKNMIVTSSDDFVSDNPDIIAIDQITCVETSVEDNREELLYKDKDGNEKSYNPPRYTYAYEFHITFKINSPWFDEISVDLNNGERPESMEDERYAIWQMRMQELVAIARGQNQTAQPAFGLETKPFSSEPLSADEVWKCPGCGTENKGSFCAECGRPCE